MGTLFLPKRAEYTMEKIVSSIAVLGKLVSYMENNETENVLIIYTRNKQEVLKAYISRNYKALGKTWWYTL